MSVACFGAVSLASGEFVHTRCEKFDALMFEAFLKKLLRHRSRGKRMVVVLDNAKCHHAVLLASLLRRYRKVLALLFLTPYSPQLAHRAGLEACAPDGDAQPILRNARRVGQRCRNLLRPLAKNRCCVAKTIRYY